MPRQKRLLSKTSPALILAAAALVFGASVFFCIWGCPAASLPALGLAAAFLGAAYIVFARQRSRRTLVVLQNELLEEEIHVVERDVGRCATLKESLKKKIRSYEDLEAFSARLNEAVRLDDLCDTVVHEVLRLFDNTGRALLYLVNGRTRRLELRATFCEPPDARIKQKTGDAFDQWVLRHARPLFVESVTTDFRFDTDAIRSEIERPLATLISVPLETSERFLGILRLESAHAARFEVDDLRLLSICGDIAHLALENALYLGHMQELSQTDPLTQLALRRYGLRRLREEMARVERSGSSLSLLMIDIDHFKQMNDTLGHTAGDVVLQRIAGVLKSFFSLPGAVVFRYGGEEFAVGLPDVVKAEAVRLAESLRQALESKDIALRRHKLHTTVSIGVAVFPQDAPDQNELLRLADDALLTAKREGRNRVCAR